MRSHPTFRAARVFVPLILAFACWTSLLQGQAPPNPPPPPPSATPAPAPAPPAAPAATPAPKPITKEQAIYIPFDQLEDVFEKEERGVFLPYREFLEMWNKLNLPAKLRENPPPVEGVLAAANYTGKIEGQVATIQAKLSFEALKEGWSKLSLGAAGLALAEAKSKAHLSAGKDGYEILFPDRGNYTLEATVYGQVTRQDGRSRLQLALPKTAVSQFELTIPEKGLDFTIEPAAAYSAVENPDGTTKLLIYFGAAENVVLNWTRRSGETALKPLLYADVATRVQLGSGAVRTDAQVQYRILRAGVLTLEVSVPKDQQVLGVEGANIREWTVEATPANAPAATAMQRVKVTLHAPARDAYVLNLKLERALPPLPQQVAIPLIRTEQTERQTGTVTVLTPAELTADVTGLQELTQQATSEAAKEGVTVAEYRYLHLPYAGQIAVAEAKPQVELTSETLITVQPERADVRAVFKGNVKRAGIFNLEIELLAGFTHFEATGPDVESSTVQSVAGKDVLNVKFKGRRTSNFAFVVTGDATRDKPDSPFTVPVFVPRADRHEAKAGVAIHVSLKANTTTRGDLREEDVRGLLKEAAPAPEALQTPRGPNKVETTPLTLGFSYRGAAKPAQLQFELRKPRVSAEVLTLLELRESLLRHRWTIDYNVEYAGINELSIAVPAEIADELQIEGEDIKERIKGDPSAPAGTAGATMTWRVVLQSKKLGSYRLELSHETPRPEKQPGEVSPVALQEIRLQNVFRETGQVAVVKDGNIEIVKSEPTALELIDPKELNPALMQEGVFLAYKFSAHPIGLKLQVSKNLFLPVPSAVVSYAVLTSVISEDESETTEAVYWVRNNGQQFFSVQLPQVAGKEPIAARLLSDAFVDGQPQQPSRRPDRNELLIRLPARADRQSFAVRFVYERPSAHPGVKLGWRGTLRLDPPRLAEIETLQSKWTVYLPSEYRYVSFGGAMRPATADRGWDLLRMGLDLFVPQFGPLNPEPGQPQESEPPPVPAAQTAGFDTQLQPFGVQFVLRRLGEPAAIEASYRAKAYAATIELIAFLLALCLGLLLTGRSLAERFVYFVVVGFGALVIAGAKEPRGAGLWQAIYLGAFLALLVWLFVGVTKIAGSFFRRIGSWRWRKSGPVRVTPSTPSTPTPPAP